MFKLTVRRVGSALVIMLSPEAARALHVQQGDRLYLTSASGGFRLTSHDPSFAETMEVAEGFMKRFKNALRELAR